MKEDMMTKCSVNFWGSHPDEDNDDCWTGADYDSLAEAKVEFEKEVADREVAWIVLDGPGIHMERKNPNFNPAPDNDDEWRREIAMQAGMAGGCDAYNEVMGWDVGDPHA